MPHRDPPVRLLYEPSFVGESVDPFDIGLVFSQSKMPMLVSGAVGSGKKHLARYVHDAAGISGNFQSITLAGLGLEEQGKALFGTRDWKGGLQEAAGGTLYIEEVADIAPSIQQRLAILLSQGTFETWYSGPTRSGNVRLVGGTRRSISDLLSGAEHSNSFLFNIGRVHIRMPPTHFLRRSTLQLLATRWVNEVVKNPLPFHDGFWNDLAALRPVGNLHELRAVVQRSHHLAVQRVESLRRDGRNGSKDCAECVSVSDLKAAQASGLTVSSEFRILSAFEAALRRDPYMSQSRLAGFHPSGMGGTDVVRLFAVRSRGGGPASTRLGQHLELWRPEFPQLTDWLRRNTGMVTKRRRA